MRLDGWFHPPRLVRSNGWGFALLLATTAAMAASPSTDAPQTLRWGGATINAFRNLEYARPDGKPVLLDLYLPQNAPSPAPVIMWIHGGGWSGGSKDQFWGLWLVARGYAVASINYRLSTEATFPAQIHDCKAAVRWLRANALKYRLDPQRIGAWGASAGGHLAALLGTSGGVKALEGDLGNSAFSSKPQAVCDFFGPTDFLSPDLPKGAWGQALNKAEAKLLGGPVARNKEKARQASPISHITRDDPPFLIMHGDQDKLVPLSQSKLLHEALKKAGVSTELHVIPGAGHGFGGAQIGQTVLGFFDRYLKGKEPHSFSDSG